MEGNGRRDTRAVKTPSADEVRVKMTRGLVEARGWRLKYGQRADCDGFMGDVGQEDFKE